MPPPFKLILFACMAIIPIVEICFLKNPERSYLFLGYDVFLLLVLLLFKSKSNDR